MSAVPGRAAMFVAGVGVGVYGMVKARRAQEALTPDGLRDRGRSLALGARMLRAEVEQARVDKEHELRDRLGLPPMARSRSTQNELSPAERGTHLKQLESRGQH